MDFRSYIYGVPEGFDLYEGNTDDLSYFQRYYDGSREHSKLTIHRRGNGQVVYSFLCYNLLSGSGRGGSFLGISVSFGGFYCIDTLKFIRFLNGLYDNILQEGVLIKSNGGQIVFSVEALKNASTEINRILGILQKNLHTVFVNDFKEIDNSFKQIINKECFLNPVEDDNEAIINALKEYSMISISSEYKHVIEDVPDIDAFLNSERNLQQNIVDLLAGKPKELSLLLKECEENISEIQRFISNTKYKDNVELSAFKVSFINGRNALINWKNQTLFKNEEITVNNSKGKDNRSNHLFSRKNKRLFYWIIVLMMLVGLSTFVTRYVKHDEPRKNAARDMSIQQVDTSKLIQEGTEALQNNDFDKAILKFNEVGKPKLLGNVNAKAVEYWMDQANKKVKEKRWQEAKKYLENTRKYGGYAALDKDIEGFQNEIDKEGTKEKKLVERKNKKEIVNMDCYVYISGYSQKKTVDGFLETIESDLKIGQNEQDFNTLQSYLDRVINQEVGCPVTDKQIAKAQDLKKISRIPKKR